MIDRRVTFALIFAIVVETGGGLIWAGRAAARLDEVEARIAEQRPVAERLARLEQQLVDVRAQLDRIERRVAKDVER